MKTEKMYTEMTAYELKANQKKVVDITSVDIMQHIASHGTRADLVKFHDRVKTKGGVGFAKARNEFLEENNPSLLGKKSEADRVFMKLLAQFDIAS